MKENNLRKPHAVSQPQAPWCRWMKLWCAPSKSWSQQTKRNSHTGASTRADQWLLLGGRQCKKRRERNKIDPNIYIRTILKDQLMVIHFFQEFSTLHLYLVVNSFSFKYLCKHKIFFYLIMKIAIVCKGYPSLISL